MVGPRNQFVKFTPPQARRITEAVRTFEAKGRSEQPDAHDPGPKYSDYWIEVTSITVSSGVSYLSWKHKQRVANASGIWQDHPDGVVSSASSPDTRAVCNDTTATFTTGSIMRAVVDIGSNNIATYTVPVAAAAPNGGASVAYLTQIGGSNGSTTSYCTYTYNCYFDAAKTQLAGGTLTVQAHRMLMVPVTAASLGIIQRDSTSAYALMAVLDEYPATNACT